MLRIKKILCPTDFSEPSFEALKVACELAQQFSSELIVMHAVQPVPTVSTGHMDPSTFNIPAYQQEMEVTANTIMQEQIAKRVPETISVRSLVLLGDPANQILRAAEDKKVDLIVIATRGQTGLKRLFFGSVAEKVVRHAPVHVLSIREKHPEV
jgi:nucleotide-binding universal stress UspA family protein